MDGTGREIGECLDQNSFPVYEQIALCTRVTDSASPPGAGQLNKLLSGPFDALMWCFDVMWSLGHVVFRNDCSE